MPTQLKTPGVYIVEPSAFSSTAIQPVPTSVTAFLGRTSSGSLTEAQTVYSFDEFTQLYGGLAKDLPLPYAVAHFFQCGGTQAIIARLCEPAPSGATADNTMRLTAATYIGDQALRTGLYLLDQVADFNLLCIPPDHRITAHTTTDIPPIVLQTAAAYCAARRAVLLIDPPARWSTLAAANDFASITPADLGITNPASLRASAVYFPNVLAPDPLHHDHPAIFAPCGMIAGLIAATDATRGVWKSPGGIDATLPVSSLTFELTDDQNAQLTPRAINCLRTFLSLGTEVRGARTLAGADQQQPDDFLYLAVRRLVFFIESSIQQGTKFAVFETNDESLWSQLRLSVTSFLADLQRQGALYNFEVNCGLGSTNTADDILNGVCNLTVDIAPTAPAEFLVLTFQITVQPYVATPA